VHYLLAVALAQTQKFNEALQEAVQAGRLAPNDPRIQELMQQIETAMANK
jgi:Flp pilus assembly protein TadD